MVQVQEKAAETIDRLPSQANGHARKIVEPKPPHVCEMAQAYVDDQLDDSSRKTFEQHIVKCMPCREYFREILQEMSMDKAAHARRFLAAADTWVKWDAVVQGTADDVRAEMRAKGTTIIYEKDGKLVREFPDGTIQPFTPSPASAS